MSTGIAGVRAAVAARRPVRSDIRPSALSPAGSQRSLFSTIPAEGSNTNLSRSDEVLPVTLAAATASQPDAVSAPSLLRANAAAATAKPTSATPNQVM